MTQNKTRVFVLIFAIAIQLCLGIAYIWSVFQIGIAKSLFDGDNALASLTFSILLVLLGIGSVIGGKLAAKYTIRKVVIMGGVILALGFFLAGFVSSKAAWLIWITYGVLGGLGMGFTYSTTIACAQKWYPNKKGLITGCIVAALGLGGVVFTPIVEALISAFGGVGVGEQKTFMVLAAIFLAVCTVGGIFMVNPSECERRTEAKAGRQYTPIQMLKTKEFYLITSALMLACMGGLMMIGFAKPIAIAKGMGEIASVAVLIISLFNAGGRLFWGFISDKLGSKLTIFILIVGSGVLALFVNIATGYTVFVLIGMIGFFYGGLLSNFPVLTGEAFGSAHVATNYGLVLSGFGLGAVASSFVAGYYKDVASEDISLMFPAFVIAAVCAAVGALFIAILYFIKRRDIISKIGDTKENS